MDIKKIAAKLPTGFAEEASGMDADQLRAEIIRAETALHECEKELKADEKLAGARELVKDIVGAYNDVKKAQRAKIQYTLHLLEERGELGVGEFGEMMEERNGGKSSSPARDSRVAPKKKKRAA